VPKIEIRLPIGEVIKLDCFKKQKYLWIITRSEITTSSYLQFHQCFTRMLFVRKLRFGSFSSYVLALAPKFRTKKTRKNVDEIDTYQDNFVLKFVPILQNNLSILLAFGFEDKSINFR